MKIRVLSIILLLILRFLQSFSQAYYIRAGKVFDGNQIPDARVIAVSNGLIEGIYESTREIPDSAVIIDASIYDSRDHQNNPWKGAIVSLTPEFSPVFLGSKNNFGRLTFEVRSYITIIPGNIFCARLLYHLAFGDVPYYYLPDFGGSILGRGYYTSRFIDRTGIYGQTEYRFPIWKIISCVAFYDIGQVQKNVNDFKINGFHHTFGFGPRFSFGSNENSILGMDFGFSNEGMMVFFHADHTF